MSENENDQVAPRKDEEPSDEEGEHRATHDEHVAARTAEPDGDGTSRRTFLDWMIVAVAGGGVAGALYPVVRYLSPIEAEGPGGPVSLTEDDAAKLDSDGYVIVLSGQRRVIVFRDAEGALQALDGTCTHEACTVQWLAEDGVVWCACHNGRFAADGSVLSGPPPRALPRHTARLRDDGVIEVTVGEGGEELAALRKSHDRRGGQS